MELRVLNYFLAVAREENITKAAQILHVTQPTLSRQIAQLEEELGVKLFRRSNHHIILTEDGMILKRRAQEIISLAEKTRQDLMQKAEVLTGEISIGSGEFLSSRILSDIIASFSKKYPKIKYSIYSGNGENVRERIERGLIDVGLITTPVDINKYHSVIMPQKELWGILAREDSPLADKEEISPQELQDVPLITTSSELHTSMVGQWLGEYYDRVNITAMGNLQYNEAVLAQSGMGDVISIKLNSTYPGLRFIPFSPRLENGTAIVWKKEQIFAPAAEAFIKYCKQYLKDISDNSI